MVMFPDFQARIAESRAKHIAPAIGAVWIGPQGTIGTVEHGETAGGTHRWHIGSCTKTMTATLFARLVDRGLIGFDTPLADALPDLAQGMDPAFRATPMSALLTHSAGIARDPDIGTFLTLRLSTATAPAQRRFLATQALREPPRPDTGYSNLGYIVLGAVIEQVTGLSWEAALAREVMIPLGIARFGFGPPEDLSGHRWRRGAWRAYPNDNPVAYGPAGRVHLALDEWGRFLRAHLEGGPFLGADTRARLHKGTEAGFAMGWLTRRRHGERWLLHTGSNTAWFAQATLIPERNIGLGIVCNAYDTRIAKAVGDLTRDLLTPDEAVGP